VGGRKSLPRFVERFHFGRTERKEYLKISLRQNGGSPRHYPEGRTGRGRKKKNGMGIRKKKRSQALPLTGCWG